jgi:hypothetical protein
MPYDIGATAGHNKFSSFRTGTEKAADGNGKAGF